MEDAMFFLIGLSCLCLVGTMTPIGLITAFSWLSNRLGNRDEVRLDSRTQRAVLQLLEHIRRQSDPLEALEQSMIALQQGAPLRLSESATLPSQKVIPLPEAATKQPVPFPPREHDQLAVVIPTQEESASQEPIPDDAAPVYDAPPVKEPTPILPPEAASTATSERVARNWFALDNISLLLYLGAGLVVIAVGVFVGSSWDNISGMARWAIVAAFALAFLGLGEIFMRRTTVLAPAGKTFRGVGMVLMPFVVLAYERFVLPGNGSALFWFITSILLAAFYYAFYYFSAAGRLTAYLGTLSLGILALLLPNLLELDNIWQAHALLLMSVILFITTWQVEPDGRALPKRLWAGKLSPLVESHLIIGVLYMLGSWLQFLALVIESASAVTLYLTLHTLLFVLLSAWFASALLAGAASLSSGIALATLLAWLLADHAQFDWFILLGWNGLAALLFVLAPKLEPHLPASLKIQTFMAIFWSGIAWWYCLGNELGTVFIAPASLALMSLFIASANRFRQSLLLWAALIFGHVAILALLDLIPSDNPSPFVPTLLWLGLAGLWLGLAYYRPSTGQGQAEGVEEGQALPLLPIWVQHFARFAFVAEALWILLFALLDGASSVVAAILLIFGWIVWTREEKQPLGVVATIAQVIYAQFALALYFPLPQETLPFAILLTGIALTTYAKELPSYAHKTTDYGGLLLLLWAPLMGAMGMGLGLEESSWFTVITAAQLTLALAALCYAALAFWRDNHPLTIIATFLTYSLTAWLTVDYLPASAAPLVTFALALLTLAIAQRSPNKSRQWLEGLALLTALVAPTTAIQAEILGAPSSALFGLSMTSSSQLSLFLSTILFAVLGWQRNNRYLIAAGGAQLYLLYSWIAIEQDITSIQAYSVPLSMLLFAFSKLFPPRPLEVASVLTLLLPTMLQTLAQPDLFYSLLLGGYGIVLLILGISFTRRIPRAAGITAILLAALRQLWSIISTLPPGIIIGIVGLAFIGVAIFLTLRRNKE